MPAKKMAWKSDQPARTASLKSESMSEVEVVESVQPDLTEQSTQSQSQSLSQSQSQSRSQSQSQPAKKEKGQSSPDS